MATRIELGGMVLDVEQKDIENVHLSVYPPTGSVRMKTKWGSCSPATNGIRLNTELVKKPRECLEYIVVHEMVHLLEPTHNSRFLAFMDRFMPKWQHYLQLLNRLPEHHERWRY
jgi:predicted metal-dependent hydrolase